MLFLHCSHHFPPTDILNKLPIITCFNSFLDALSVLVFIKSSKYHQVFHLLLFLLDTHFSLLALKRRTAAMLFFILAQRIARMNEFQHLTGPELVLNKLFGTDVHSNKSLLFLISIEPKPAN